MTDDIASLRASVERLTAQAADERKRHRLQLMAIEVCAGCNTLESARKQRIHPSSPYWTSAYAYTFEAVAREMRERARADDAEATIERLTRERDEAIGALRLSETRVTMLLGVERTHVAFSKTLHDLVGLDTSGDFDPDALPDRLRELVAIEQAWEAEHGPDGGKSAEATIARLAKVVRAALAYYATMQVGAGHATGCPLIERNEPCTCGDAEDAALDASFRSLTAEDRRRAGIEG